MQTEKIETYHKGLRQTALGKSEQKIVRYFANTFMGYGHKGLTDIAKDHGVDVTNLEKGEYVIFVNKAKTALKMFAPANIIVHLKMPDGVPLDLRTISIIPRFFNGSEIQYTKALEEILRKDLEKKK